MTPEELNEQTKEDWRDLGFFYDYDNSKACWQLIGSRTGLLRFCDILIEYTANDRKKKLSEHEHYGPYWYLKLVTWNAPVITPHDIRGTFEDFRRLSSLTREKIAHAFPGDRVEIDKEYSSGNEAILLFEVREDSFDPASGDPLV
jgi:hypothetical protein